MHIKKLIAIPAIAIAAGLGLAACGSSGSSGSGPNPFSSPDVPAATLGAPMPLHNQSGTVTLAKGTQVTPVCDTVYADGEQNIFSVLVDSGTYKGGAGTIMVIMPLGARLLAPWNAAPTCPSS